MCTTTVDGVLIVREGAGRLRWAHELEGSPPPLHGHEWQVAALWPDAEARGDIRARVDSGRPVLVVLDSESPAVELPVEHVASVPEGVEVDEDREAGMLTMHVPFLDWLAAGDRIRGLAFAEETRAMIETAPRFQLPPLVIEADPRWPVVFAYRTGACSLSSALLRDAARHVTRRAELHRVRSAGATAPTLVPAPARATEAENFLWPNQHPRPAPRPVADAAAPAVH